MLPIGEFKFSGTGRQLVEATLGGSLISAPNSSTTPLGGGATFNGAYFQVLDFAQIIVAISSDVDSAVGGVQITFSQDGVTDDTTSPPFFYDASEGFQTFISPVLGEFVKIDYVNGAGAQATFRIETTAMSNAALSILHPANGPLHDNSLASVTKAILTGRDQGTGAWNIVDVDALGGMSTTPTASGKLQYIRDTVLTDVTMDTGVPGNIRALPVTITALDGDINITAGAIEVDLTHGNDSVRLGDGTTLVDVTLANELEVHDADALTQLTAINTDLDVALSTRASEATLLTVAGAVHAEDSAHTDTDSGIAILGVHKEFDDQGVDVDANDDYTIPHIDVRGRLRVSPGAQHLIDLFSATTGWAVINDDAANLALATDHVLGSGSLTFDKVNGTANTPFALIEKTVPSFNLVNLATGAIFLQCIAKLPDVTDVLNLVMRMGTDSSNYNTWKIDASVAIANKWESFRILIADSEGSTGAGWNATAITYVAIGVEFSSQSDTLVGILVDAMQVNSGQVTSSDTTSDITSQISSSNVNIQKVGNKVTNTQAGNVGTGTQRITIADDDTNLSKIPDQGAAVIANSWPVNIASDQIIPVSATDLDIRDLTSASDSVEAVQATHDNLNLNSNIQVANVDVANGNPVPVSDAGGSITVDSTNLDIRNLTSASDSVEAIQDTHDDLNLNANIQVANVDVANGNPVPISDAGGSITVDGTLSTTSAGLDPVTLSGTPVTMKHDYSSTPVTTGAYVQVTADSGDQDSIEIDIFDSSGEDLFLAFGAAASEVNQMIITPGGNGRISLRIPANTRVSIKAVTATASDGFLVINTRG